MQRRFLIVFALLLATVIYETIGNLDSDWNYMKQCNQTSPVTLRALKEFLVNKKVSSQGAGNLKCFLHCLLVKYGWMDEVGGFFLPAMKQLLQDSGLDQATVDFVLFSCTWIRSDDRCERAFLFAECFWKKTTETQTETDRFFYNLDKK